VPYAPVLRPVPDDLGLLLTVADLTWIDRLFADLETQRYNVTNVTLRDPPVVIVTTTGEEKVAAASEGTAA
jgi:hypothetical protein